VAPAASRGEKLLDVSAEFFVDLGRDLVGGILGEAGGGTQPGNQRQGEDDVPAA
jgi:hypothetical protein